MTDAHEFAPNLRQPKKIALLFVVDMWGIEGPYADGNWHKLIHQVARSWATENPNQEPATLWSVVRPCDFFDNETSCYMTCSTKLPDIFFDQLNSYMTQYCGPHVTVAEVDFDLPFKSIEGWRAYLHFEQGQVWGQTDAISWRALD